MIVWVATAPLWSSGKGCSDTAACHTEHINLFFSFPFFCGFFGVVELKSSSLVSVETFLGGKKEEDQ